MRTRVKTNKFGDVKCAKYKLVTPRLSIDGVHDEPQQLKVVSLKEKKKRAPPSISDNYEKHQHPSIAMLHDKIKTLTEYTHALQHRINKEHLHRMNLEYELTILSRYVVN